MKKIIFTPLLFISFYAFSQKTFKIVDPLVDLEAVLADEEYVELDAGMLSTTDKTIDIEFKKIKSESPEDWFASICTPGICFPFAVDKGTDELMPTTERKLFRITWKIPSAGSGSIVYDVWDKAFPNDKARVTFNLKVNEPTSINSAKMFSNISVYPMPAADMISMNMANHKFESLTITDLTGKQVMQQPINGFTENINVANLERGIYMLSLNGANNYRRLIHLK
jgi:hypothetical protein